MPILAASPARKVTLHVTVTDGAGNAAEVDVTVTAPLPVVRLKKTGGWGNRG